MTGPTGPSRTRSVPESEEDRLVAVIPLPNLTTEGGVLVAGRSVRVSAFARDVEGMSLIPTAVVSLSLNRSESRSWQGQELLSDDTLASLVSSFLPDAPPSLLAAVLSARRSAFRHSLSLVASRLSSVLSLEDMHSAVREGAVRHVQES